MVMKIALVHGFFTQWGGAERVLKTFSEIWPEAPIYLLAKDQKLIDEFLPGRIIIPSFLQDWPGMPAGRKYYLPFLPKAIESFNFSDFDVVLSDCSSFEKGVITKPPTKHVCYLHTPTRYLTRDRDEYLANASIPLPFIGRPVVRAITEQVRKWDLQASKRPDYLIANSHFIAAETKKYYGRTADTVFFPPVDTSMFEIADKTGDYFLVLGRTEPYKRTDLAILAATKLGLTLKVVGGGSHLDELKKLAGPTVEFVGRVPDPELAGLYANCIALIHPQLEDAGITPLESMASGRPVIAYAAGGALESVLPGGTGEFFQEQTVESLVAVLKNFDVKKYNPEKIRAVALQFDAKIFKEKIKQIVESQTSH